MTKNLLEELKVASDFIPLTFYNLNAIKVNTDNFGTVKMKTNTLYKTRYQQVKKLYKPISRIPK